MKKLMFTALAVASCSAFAAATPEPDFKAYNVTVTKKSIQTVHVLKTKKNIPAEDVDQAWEEAEEAALADWNGEKYFYPDAYRRGQLREDGQLDYWESTNKNGKVTIKWLENKATKNGTNVVAATKVCTDKQNYIFFLDRDNNQVAATRYQSVIDIPGFKYYGHHADLYVYDMKITDDGKVMSCLTPTAGNIILAGQGKAAKSNTADKSGPYDYAKTLAGGYADVDCTYGTWKWSYDKKLSKAFQEEVEKEFEQGGSIDSAVQKTLESKKIYYLP